MPPFCRNKYMYCIEGTYRFKDTGGSGTHTRQTQPMSGCCAPPFGAAGPRPPEGRARSAPAPRAALPTQSRSTHGAPIQKRQLRGAKRRPRRNLACMPSLRSAPDPEPPERGRSGGLTPPPRPPAAALRRARPPPSDVGRAPHTTTRKTATHERTPLPRAQSPDKPHVHTHTHTSRSENDANQQTTPPRITATLTQPPPRARARPPGDLACYRYSTTSVMSTGLRLCAVMWRVGTCVLVFRNRIPSCV